MALKFWTRLALWTGILLVIFVFLGLQPGEGVGPVLAHLPAWAGLALVLSAYPAGLAVSRETLPGERFVLRRLIEVALAAALVSLMTLVLAEYVGPEAQRWLNEAAGGAGATAEPAELPFGDLRRELIAAIEQARADTTTEPSDRWRLANQLFWNYDSRLAGSALPFLFGWIGVLAGFWTRLTSRAGQFSKTGHDASSNPRWACARSPFPSC